jgi:Glyoxalase/Bleomycin resistance protein/Dioxygenase superfamily
VFSHIFTGASDFNRAFVFYEPILKELGLVLRFHDPEHKWAGWQPSEGGRPLFILGKPFDGHAHDPGNGQMVAFQAQNRAKVIRVYEMAISLGAKPEGEPGLRPHYHANYFGAYFRDSEGNKVCVACHAPDTQ